MNDTEFVVAPDGHVMSKSEVDEARRVDEAVSIEGAPDTKRVHQLSIDVDRLEHLIRTYETSSRDLQVEHDRETDLEKRGWVAESLAEYRQKVSDLRRELDVKRGELARLRRP